MPTLLERMQTANAEAGKVNENIDTSNSLRIESSGIGGVERPKSLLDVMRNMNEQKSSKQETTTTNKQKVTQASSEDWKIKPEKQAELDKGRVFALQQELAREQENLAVAQTAREKQIAQTNVDAIRRELVSAGFKGNLGALKGRSEADMVNPDRAENISVAPTQPTGQPVVRNRAGQIVKNPNEMIPGAIGGLSRTIGGAARGAASQVLGGLGDINELVREHVTGEILPNMPALPTTKAIQEKILPAIGLAQPTSQEGKVSQSLGEVVIPVPSAGKILKNGKAALKGAEKFVRAEEAVQPAKRIEPSFGNQPVQEVGQVAQEGRVPSQQAQTLFAENAELRKQIFATDDPKVKAQLREKIDQNYQKVLQSEKGLSSETISQQGRVPANEPLLRNVGSAERSNESALQAAMAQASPELRAELSTVKPQDLNIPVLERHLEADSLPVPVRLTKGQALQDPILISKERNERGIKEQYANHFNDQNKALQESATLMKDRVAPNIHTTSHVADSEQSINLINKKIAADDEAISNAYKALENYGAGKIQVDSLTFGNSAKQVLSDDIEFLPTIIANRLESYANGKEMNFNQFENLRTILARETRKAQKAGDGNVVHALGVVRSELEKMPLIGETAEAKVLADNARALSKQQFDLLDKKRETYNPLYEKVFNGGADTKDFIQSLILRGDNKDFNKTIQLAQTDPTLMEHLQSGTLDAIIRDSTDASGNFLTGKFAKHIENLDVNKRLDALFGENAKTLRNIANTGKLVEARPKGSYVNESNTAVAGAVMQMASQYAGKVAKGIPGIKHVVEPAAEIIANRKVKKQVAETLKPGAGVRLSDIGK
jgi:hypothetical protein